MTRGRQPQSIESYTQLLLVSCRLSVFRATLYALRYPLLLTVIVGTPRQVLRMWTSPPAMRSVNETRPEIETEQDRGTLPTRVLRNNYKYQGIGIPAQQTK